MKTFEALKKLREYERGNMSLLSTIIDWDIVIEIGYAEEQGKPLTIKQLFLLNISSRSTVRRRLSRLTEKGMVLRKTQKNDTRTSVLTLPAAHHKLCGSYLGTLANISSVLKAA